MNTSDMSRSEEIAVIIRNIDSIISPINEMNTTNYMKQQFKTSKP